MRMTERQFGDVVVLDMNGPITGPKAAAMLESAVRRLCRKGARRVIADLGDVRSVDLAGRGALVDAHIALRQADGVFGLACVTNGIRDLVVITRLLTVFETYESVEDAVVTTATSTGTKSPAVSALRLGSTDRLLRGA